MLGCECGRYGHHVSDQPSPAMSSYEDVASMGDFHDEDFSDTGCDSDMGSGAEF